MLCIFLFSACIQEAIELPPPKKEEIVLEPESTKPDPINHPPVIHALTWENSSPKAKDTVRVQVKASDHDNDRIRYQYRWKVNDAEKRTEGRAMLPSHYYKKGDIVRIEVTASDQENESAPMALEISIGNTPPSWVEDPRLVREIDGYQVRAKDPDDDPITYSLEGAPKGMSIDSKTGILRYKGSVDAKRGSYDIHVLATDSEGDYIKWSFSINVQ